MKNAKGSRIERPNDTGNGAAGAPSAQLSGILLHGQERANHFATEFGRGKQEDPASPPFITGGLSEDPWMAMGPASPRSREQWKHFQTT